MNPQLLIDAIVRQTTVLVARLSTVEGVRSPLGHVANEVFLGLVSELETQGFSNKTIADLFGMALRSYRVKVQRLGESEATRGVTLWDAVQRFLAERGSATRKELLACFHRDEKALLRGILNDLTVNGLIVRSGRGHEARYRIATDEKRSHLGSFAKKRRRDSNVALVWAQIYRYGPLTLEGLAHRVALPRSALVAAVEALIEDRRVRREQGPSGEQLVAEEVLPPVGRTASWEEAIVDHHRTALNAIAAKLTKHTRTSTLADEVGGTTLTFDLWPGHPYEQEVRSLLRATRARVLPLWKKLDAHRREHPGFETYQVHYYCGQYVVS